ncbi:AbrB/MazE/SpoVT family DNA-binding domain-containing protein [[Brevibacterium] frigoritolerans]|nr:AbrB/MazE/SpoVT family DNA-binding domain-containing protein [Peribacillus frigoritolerans]
MKATGIVRRVDELGRIVMPKEIRKVYDINNGEPLEIYVEDDMIIIKKYAPENPCIITGKVSPENKKIAGGKITISPEGLDILKNEINNA